MKSGKEIEEVLKKFGWKDFENLVADIFEENGFRVLRNYRFKTKKRYEVDVVAIKPFVIFCVDCKKWKGGRYKKSLIKSAAFKQEERVKEFSKILRSNPNFHFFRGKVIPLIVTWLEEGIIKENDTLIIPLWKLNSFLINLEKYVDVV